MGISLLETIISKLELSVKFHFREKVSIDKLLSLVRSSTRNIFKWSMRVNVIEKHHSVQVI